MAKAGTHLGAVCALNRSHDLSLEICGDLRCKDVPLFCRNARLADLFCCILFLAGQFIGGVGGLFIYMSFFMEIKVFRNALLEVFDSSNIIFALGNGMTYKKDQEHCDRQMFPPSHIIRLSHLKIICDLSGYSFFHKLGGSFFYRLFQCPSYDLNCLRTVYLEFRLVLNDL